MEFEDFKTNYDRVEICNMTPDALTESTNRHWEVNVFEGSWIRGSTAGGCRNYIGEKSWSGSGNVMEVTLRCQSASNPSQPSLCRHVLD